jgi:hypothetical protein
MKCDSVTAENRHSLNLFWDDKSIFKDNNNKELSFTNASYETWWDEIKVKEIFDDRKIRAEWVCEVDEEEVKIKIMIMPWLFLTIFNFFLGHIIHW